VVSSELIYENDPYDKVTCLICGKQMRTITESHTLKIHGIKIKEYQEIFNGAPIVSKATAQKLSDKVKGDKNPAYQHGGRLSPFSTKFKKYNDLSEQEKEDKINNTYQKAHETSMAHPERDKVKNELLENHGYKFYRVAESDFRNDPSSILNYCLDFLKLA
jgi:hypothetical protein